MGKASSAKKVARAARAGGNRRPGQRRAIGFPLLMGSVLVLGVSLVLFARGSREANAAPISQASDSVNFDHWHAAYGVFQCDHFIFGHAAPTDGTTDTDDSGTFFTDLSGDPLGIHTHGDGVIHIHPFQDSAGGRNARIGLWFQDIGMTVTDDKIIFPDGLTVWDEATTTCGEGDAAKPGQIVIAKWNDAQDAADGERPSELITDHFGDIRFRNDREYYTIAFVTEDQLETIPVRDGIIETLNNLGDVDPSANLEPTDTTPATDSTATTEPDAASTTATTAAGGSTTATTATPTTAAAETPTTSGG
jgi:hypothetical protein